jgi:uncharacterized protein (PEP-CTERM system associated)
LTPACCLSAALLYLAAPSGWAQYGSKEPGISGAGGRGRESVPARDEKDQKASEREKRAWEIRPRLTIEETYTDNVVLAPAGLERSDWVTKLSPGISILRRGPRLQMNVSYAADGLYRAEEGGSSLKHQLNAFSRAELAEQLLFVDTRANISQQNVSLLGPQAESDVNVTGNRTSVRTFSVSPYLRRNFGQDARGEARLTYSAVSSSAVTSSSNSEANRADLRLSSGPSFKLLTWNLAYSKQHIDFTRTDRSVEIEKVTAEARRLITPQLGLLMNIGYEDNNFPTIGPAPRGSFWRLGPEWRPTPRTLLAATTGKRYFGDTYSFDFRHRTRLTTWNVNYNEDITTANDQALDPSTEDTFDVLDDLFSGGIPDPVIRRSVVEEFIEQNGLPSTLQGPLNSLSTSPFLQKRLRARFGIQGVRNTIMANVFTQTREATAPNLPGAGDFAQSPETRQAGASLLWTLRMTAQTTSNASIGYTRNEFPALARKDNRKFLRLSLTRRLGPRISGTVAYRRIENDSNEAGASHTENAVSAALRIRY